MRVLVAMVSTGMLALSGVHPALANGPILGTERTPASDLVTPSPPPPIAAPAPLPPSPPPISAPAPPLPVFAPGYNWSGFYLGANLGGGWTHQDVTMTRSLTIDGTPPLTGTRSGSTSGSGIIGGGHFGFNYQFPSWVGGIPSNWVLGIEADINAADITNSFSRCAQTAQGVVFSCASLHSSLDDFGTVRGRLGYAFNNVLLYGTGGWAWADTSTTANVTCLGTGCPATSLPISRPPVHFSLNPDGWSAGGGIEWGFLPNWSARAEYLHLQFDGITRNTSFVGSTAGGVPITATANVKANLGVDIARVGVTYKFNLF